MDSVRRRRFVAWATAMKRKLPDLRLGVPWADGTRWSDGTGWIDSEDKWFEGEPWSDGTRWSDGTGWAEAA